MGSNLGQVVLAKCKNCGKLFIPPAYMCSACGDTDFSEMISSGKGKVLSYTTIRVPPLGFQDQAPYQIGVIELWEGVHLIARIFASKGEEVKIGGNAFFMEKDSAGAYWFKVEKN
jgi:uncharacterized OB-fold protein